MIPQQKEFPSQIGQFQTLRKKSQPFGEEIFMQKQKKKLQQALESLKQYPKITAIMIKHQERSIESLPKAVVERFGEFKQRVPRSIQCCKKNSEFLENVKRMLQTSLKLKKYSTFGQSLYQQVHQCGGISHSHSHQEGSSTKILNIFNHLCRQYSEQTIHKEERYFVDFIKETLASYIDSNSQKLDNMKTLVLGSGMGRSLAEVKNVYQEKSLPLSSCMVQGHQEDAQLYLFGQYLLNHHQAGKQSTIIYPYIHNFSNNLYKDTPYSGVQIKLAHDTCPLVPLTFGSFQSLYKSHKQEWSVILSTFFNYSITDVLQYIQLVFKMLKKGGLWIDICTASFQKHLIPYFSYGQYQNILQKSQFKLVKKFTKDQLWYQEPNKMMKQWRRVHYRVMRKVD